MVCNLDNKNTCSMLGFKCFDTATFILSGVEAMHMIKKEQIDLWDLDLSLSSRQL